MRFAPLVALVAAHCCYNEAAVLTAAAAGAGWARAERGAVGGRGWTASEAAGN